jgi:hypothetical protein
MQDAQTTEAERNDELPGEELGEAPELGTEFEIRRLRFRVGELEALVDELVRQVGGPRRDLTLRPQDDLKSTVDRIDRDLGQLETRLDRLERRFDRFQRDLDRLMRELRRSR